MEARLTPRRLLLCAAAPVAVAGVVSGCGGGSNAQAAPNDPLVKYSSSSLSFMHPASWKAHPFRWAGELHFRPLVYLSTQPLHDPCSTQGNTTSCGFPVQHLRTGGALVFWNASNPPATSLGPGAEIQVDGRPARRVETAGGMCRSLIQTQHLPSPPTELTACLRGPGLAEQVKRVDALLASTKLFSP